MNNTLSTLDDAANIADLTGMVFFDEAALLDASTSYENLGFSACVDKCVLFLTKQDKPVWVVGNPFDDRLFSFLSVQTSYPVEIAFSLPAMVEARLKRDGHNLRAIDTIDQSADAQETGLPGNLTLASIAADQNPVIKIVHASLYDAWKIGASDIHFETAASGLHIKCRLDGVLTSLQKAAGAQYAEQIVSRLKVMAELDIAERRIPQDGRFKLQLDGRSVDFRVSVMPSALGEDVVVRVLDKRSAAGDEVISLAGLGFNETDTQNIHRMAWEPHGMLLVTGPTGSGKTTTLYAVVNELQTGEEKIITIEDPVEYDLPGVLQIPVNDKKGLTFARGLRSILRHDPDKILVGEIRDSETAQIAIQSALTGHLVLTTVHANNTFDVIGRFTHMGVDPYHFVSALNGVIAQRLIRKNCRHCLAVDEQADKWLSQMAEKDQLPSTLYKGLGCSHCRGTGYQGRTVVVEILLLDDILKQLIIEKTPLALLKQHAAGTGFRSLRSRAIELLVAGHTSIHEVVRVVGLRAG